AVVGVEDAVDGVEGGGLPGTVWPDQRGDRSLGHLEGRPVDGADAPGRLVEVRDGQECHAGTSFDKGRFPRRTGGTVDSDGVTSAAAPTAGRWPWNRCRPSGTRRRAPRPATGAAARPYRR